MVVLLSPPRRGAQDRGEQAGYLGRVGLPGPSAPPVARLVTEPVGALAAGGSAALELDRDLLAPVSQRSPTETSERAKRYIHNAIIVGSLSLWVECRLWSI